MKFHLALLLSVSMFGGCQIAQPAESVGLSNNVEVNRQLPAGTTENDRPIVASPAPADDSAFSPVDIKRTDRKPKFDLKIDVTYPQLKDAKTVPQIAFNRFVKKEVDEQVADFTKFLAEKEKSTKPGAKNEYEINLAYQVDYFSDSFTSVVMQWDGFSGYLNQDYFPSTINFDLKSGKVVEQKDLFEPDVDYLKKLSESSRKILRKTCLSCGCGEKINAGDPLPPEMVPAESIDENSNTGITKVAPPVSWTANGTKPEAGNFRNLSMTTAGLKITFGEYQVGPGCIGIIDIIIPFEDLRGILRKDLNFN
jgi:hypothetical protein